MAVHRGLNIWSDGPSSQFKNRYMANCLPLMNVAYHCQTSWNFFATSHGKGPVDGVGGAVKRAVRDMVRCRRAIVIDVRHIVHLVAPSPYLHEKLHQSAFSQRKTA